ncbi:MAG: hypothetical protein IJA76_05120 [Clostridia bacterium]|nr:hypothetical protein [Clostridia bacterium]MBQ4586969.1 hypothetical protein [Clostridia bacterium]
MLIAIIGENCAGKTTLANAINKSLNAKVFAGKDYLRLAKSPAASEQEFIKLLSAAVSGDNLIYIITERTHLGLLPDGAFKIVITAPLETIKERFKARMRGNLPPPVEQMLEKNHGIFDGLDCNLILDQNYNVSEVLSKIKSTL